jgi:Flp pilus assembly pilin Flp
MRSDSSHRGAFCRDDRGGITVEYAVLVALVAVGLAGAVLGVGRALVATFMARETWLLLPFP